MLKTSNSNTEKKYISGFQFSCCYIGAHRVKNIEIFKSIFVTVDNYVNSCLKHF